MKSLLKTAREQKGLTTRQVSESLTIDQALVSKFENGQRRPTQKQLLALADLLEIDREILITEWLKSKILEVIDGNEFGIKAVRAVLSEISETETTDLAPEQLQKLIHEMESLKSMLSGGKK